MNQFCSQAYTAGGLTTLGNFSSDNIYTYILKGYPTSLKLKFTKKVRDILNDNYTSTYDYNGNPISVLCKSSGFQIVDESVSVSAATSAYGITESVIDLNAFQNPFILQKKRTDAILLLTEIKKEEKRCVGYISAAKGIIEDCKRYEAPYIDRAGLNRFVAGLWKKQGASPSGQIGKETKYFAEALSGSGTDFPFEKFSSMCETVNSINDFSTVISASVADKIRLYALSCGFDVISFADFLDTRAVRHVIIPELKYGFFSAGRFFNEKAENTKAIKKYRFLKQEYSDYVKNKKRFCRKAYNELICEASASVSKIENLKKRLDNLYLSATDIDRFITESMQKVTIIDKSLQ